MSELSLEFLAIYPPLFFPVLEEGGVNGNCIKPTAPQAKILAWISRFALKINKKTRFLSAKTSKMFACGALKSSRSSKNVIKTIDFGSKSAPKATKILGFWDIQLPFYPPPPSFSLIWKKGGGGKMATNSSDELIIISMVDKRCI